MQARQSVKKAEEKQLKRAHVDEEFTSFYLMWGPVLKLRRKWISSLMVMSSLGMTTLRREEEKLGMYHYHQRQSFFFLTRQPFESVFQG